MYRAYVPLQNVDAFYKAFDIKAGDGMYIASEKRVKIW
jgi:endothelin-converting enzyme/putative endopeptidase